MGPLPSVIRALIAINVVAFLAEQVLGDRVLLHLALWPLGPPHRGVLGDSIVSIVFEPWQLVTYGFLHGNLAHIALNMVGLYFFGPPLARTLGTRAFTVYYLVCVIGAGLAQLLALELAGESAFHPTVGASGGIFGLLLGFGMLFPRATIFAFPLPPMPAWLAVIVFAVIELGSGFWGIGRELGIAHFAHVGGMIAGFVMMRHWRDRLPSEPS